MKQNFDINKVYKALVDILEKKYNVSIKTEIIKLEVQNGKEN